MLCGTRAQTLYRNQPLRSLLKALEDRSPKEKKGRGLHLQQRIPQCGNNGKPQPEFLSSPTLQGSPQERPAMMVSRRPGSIVKFAVVLFSCTIDAVSGFRLDNGNHRNIRPVREAKNPHIAPAMEPTPACKKICVGHLPFSCSTVSRAIVR